MQQRLSRLAGPGWSTQPQALEIVYNYRLATTSIQQNQTTNSIEFGTETQSRYNRSGFYFIQHAV